MSVVEIEVDSALNESLFFSPLQQRVRGRFDMHRVREPKAMSALNQWPEAIPGQRLRLDMETGRGSIVETLRQPGFDRLRAKIAKTYGIPEDRTIESAHVPTWLFWMRRAVEGGVARIVSGDLPEVAMIEGTPQRNFYSREFREPMDRLADAIESQTKAMTDLLKALAKR